MIPDLATWCQCLALYVTVVAGHQPSRLANLMGYHSLITRAGNKFKWPSWVIYNQNFR